MGGELLAGRYRVEHEIGSGGMGVVLAVRHAESGKRYALKVVKRELAPLPTVMERFKREAQILADIRHPGVVAFRDAGILDDGSLFLVMEHVEGETLLHLLSRRAPMPARELAPILTSIASALDAVAAAGIVHRDLKPSNVVVCPDGSAKLLDFGVARAVRLDRLTLTGSSIGTPRYMAPEQLRGVEEVDARADQYALGVIAYGALAGRPPFEKPGMQSAGDILAGHVTPLASLRPDLPAEVVQTIARAMSVDRTSRFESAGAFARAFETGASAATSPTARAPSTITGDEPTGPAFADEHATSFGESYSERTTPRRLPIAVLVGGGIGAALLGLGVAIGASIARCESAPAEPVAPSVPVVLILMDAGRAGVVDAGRVADDAVVGVRRDGGVDAGRQPAKNRTRRPSPQGEVLDPWRQGGLVDVFDDPPPPAPAPPPAMNDHFSDQVDPWGQ